MDRVLRTLHTLMVCLLGACLLASVARAQAPVRASGPCYPGHDVTTPRDLRVVRACSAGKEVYTTTTRPGAEDQIAVLVPGLDSYIRFYNASKNPNPDENPAKLILYVNGRPITNWHPLLPAEGHSDLRFDLKSLTGSTQNRQAWTTLLDDSLRGHRVMLSVGFESQRPFASDVDDFELRAISPTWFTVWLVMSAAVLALVVWASKSGNILRVPGPEPSNEGSTTPAPRKAYSLARVQMAAWFLTVLAAYVLIYLVTGALDTITTTVLGLMGISAATGIAATVVDVAAAGAGAPPSSRGFWTDVVSDDAGMSLPRLQILVWTVVLTFIFAKSVYETVAMPEFSTTLLGLMGISGGTYIGFKRPDQRS